MVGNSHGSRALGCHAKETFVPLISYEYGVEPPLDPCVCNCLDGAGKRKKKTTFFRLRAWTLGMTGDCLDAAGIMWNTRGPDLE